MRQWLYLKEKCLKSCPAQWYSIGSMVRHRILPGALAVVFLATAWFSCAAQSVPEASPGAAKVKVVVSKQRPVPFPPASWVAESADAIEFRGPDQMTAQDRDLEADAESSIAEHAGFQDMEFNEGKWSYRQIVCPALPNHLFLRFTRYNGARDVSVFSASIPRNGEGRVRIIPILRRSYSLFEPAPINALTIAAFNRIRAEDHPVAAEGWLGFGLCYAALAGANPQLPQPGASPSGRKSTSGVVAVLDVSVKGDTVMRFTDVSAQPRPMQWSLTFNAKRKLLKAAHDPAPRMVLRMVPKAPAGQQGKVIPASEAYSDTAAIPAQ
jgi:hypothetical protein